ncbi:YihY/virulence factor BrkB family protein [Chloroflexota bacterium]
MERAVVRLEGIYLRFDHLLGGRLSLLAWTALAFGRDNGATMSRSIAYFALFSFFPLLLILISLSSSVLTAREVREVILDSIQQYLPAAGELVEANMQQLLDARSAIGVLALVGLLWSASGVFSAIYRSVNRAWGNTPAELFWTEKLFALVVVLGVGLLLVATVLYGTVVSVIRGWQLEVLGWQPFADPGTGRLVGWLSALIPALVSVIIFTTLYRTVPRTRVAWRDVWFGGLIAGLIWVASSQLLAWYISSFARYSLIYGSVGAIIAFLLWSYVSAMILLLGAEFTAQYTQWRREGRPLESRPFRQWVEDWS